MKKEKILVAMSGGVDSAVAALLLKQQGYETAGITMQLWADDHSVLDDPSPISLDENCLDAKKVADHLGISHYCISYGETFKKSVIERFIAEYAQAKTPNPCVFCNKYIKFGVLLEKARTLGFDRLATGHYARIEKDQNGKALLKKAADTKKDQSYFLWSLSSDVLSSVVFPLGELTKDEIRQVATENALASAHRSDSQDICFIPDGDYVSFIQTHSDLEFPRGRFIDINGKPLGEHEGLIRYTVGQRKGLGIAFGKPMFVGSKNASDNTVMLCEDHELYRDTLTATNINLIACSSFDSPVRLEAKIRYRHTAATATVEQIAEDKLLVKFDSPQRAIAAGQSLVLYDGDTVIGGGIIE
jgi:tRNA-specific 2-thiouridylase